MDVSEERALDVSELESIVRDAEPTAWLAPPRILRRVIKRDKGLEFLGLQVPHRQVYTIAEAELRAVIEGEELGLRPDQEWPPVVILLARPELEELAISPRELVLIDYWRMLFHARAHVAVEGRFADGSLTDPVLHDRIGRIGRVEFDEVRSVLRQEHMLLPPGDDRSAYVEFAATYLELRYFTPTLLPHVFPGIEDHEAVGAVLAGDVDGPALFAATRLAGTPDPEATAAWAESSGPEPEEETAGGGQEEEPTESVRPVGWMSRWLIRRAEAAAERGNAVRAAVLRTRALRHATGLRAEPLRLGARAELDRLVGRLQRALGFDDAEAERWRRSLPVLLDRSARGFWTPEARLLYDLQKVCLDHEREVFAIDLLGWLASGGRTPLQRPRPHLREVMISIHLRGAARRLPAVRLAPGDRVRLDGLLRPAVARAEANLRDRLRGPIEATLQATDIRPSNLPERVAARKLVEELLDRIVRGGFLSLGDLRDACSRNNLNLPDLSGPIEFVRGDRLLQADRALARALDGVYRRGEVYLRWMQRLSSLAFATPSGRFLTAYVALPYGGVFIALEGLQHLFDLIVYALTRVEVHVHFVSAATVALHGTVALGLINFPGFRRRFLDSLGSMGRALRAALIDLPTRMLNLPLVRLILEGRLARAVWDFVLKPLVVSTPFWLLGKPAGLDPRETTVLGLSAFLLASILLNSRLGRDVEEIVADEAVRAWHQFYRDVIPGLFRAIMALFNRFLEIVERLLYAVDEWLRFRRGQGAVSLAAKVVLGGLWFVLAYVIRIYVNLLIEPQINPIKHFPVVTVSHKIILPFFIKFKVYSLLYTPLAPLVGRDIARLFAVTTIFLIPGVFGFLVWELKENWRLYRANRPESLGPVVVGDHGETLVRLLRPGFHSGTLPKLFAKLRKSERRALRDGREKAELKHREALHHVEDAIRRFVERELLALLRESRSLGPLGIGLGKIGLSTNRIKVELRAADDGGEGLWIAFEEHSGCLTAHLAAPGWQARLSDARNRALTTALAGLYKMSGVDLVRIPLRSSPSAPTDGRHDGSRLIAFDRVVVPWRRWVEAWERDQAEGGHPTRVVEGVKLLPPPGRKSNWRKTSRR